MYVQNIYCTDYITLNCKMQDFYTDNSLNVEAKSILGLIKFILNLKINRFFNI